MTLGNNEPKTSPQEPANPNQMPFRQAMGLGDGLEDRLGSDIFITHADLHEYSSHALLSVIDDDKVPLPRRYVAGSLLALKGDPRIDCMNPPMVSFSAASADLGTEEADIDNVVSQWQHAGVIREWISKECPRHELQLNSFAIGKFPVTNQEFYRFLQDTGAEWLPSSWTLGQYPVLLSNHPVWTIPPEAADAYVQWLAERTGRHFRLPTEAEWEYAAAGSERREYPWGDHFDPNRANTVEAGPLGTTPIGIYSAGRTPTGIYDLGGNVEEYTADNYAPYPGGAHVRDDLQLTEGDYRVARGGGFSRYGDLARCARRHGWFKSDLYAMGFRIAETI